MNKTKSNSSQAFPEVKRKGKARAVQARKQRQNKAKLEDGSHLLKISDELSTFDKSVFSSATSVSRSELEFPIKTPKEERKKQVKSQSKKIRLYFENSRKYKNFTLFEEKNIPMRLCKRFCKLKNESVGDDDCMTEDEQIQSALKSINKSLKNGIKTYLEDQDEVENICKYQKKAAR